MKLTLNNPKTENPENSEWIPYLYGDEIDIQSVETTLFRIIDRNPMPKTQLFELVFKFCLTLAERFNTKLGYQEETLQMGAVLIHQALIERSLGESDV